MGVALVDPEPHWVPRSASRSSTVVGTITQRQKGFIDPSAFGVLHQCTTSTAGPFHYRTSRSLRFDAQLVDVGRPFSASIFHKMPSASSDCHSRDKKSRLRNRASRDLTAASANGCGQRSLSYGTNPTERRWRN